MKLKGKLTKWKDAAGYGFITPEHGGEDVFVHIKAFAKSHQRPTLNEGLTYELSSGTDGRPQASNVRREGEKQALGGTTPRIVLAIGFWAILIGLSFNRSLPVVILGVYAALSIVTFFTYAWDKLAANRNWRRVPEANLHGLELLGGWPGGLIAQIVLRHKNRKRSYQLVFWLLVSANCGALAWLLSPFGSILLDKFWAYQ